MSELLYVLATSKVISKWVQTCGSVRSWRLYSAAPLGNQAANTVTCYPTQSHYPETEPNSYCPILIKPSANINFKAIGLTRLGFEPVRLGFSDLQKRETGALLIRPSRLVLSD